MSNDVAEAINQLIAGRFGHVGLRQLHTKLFCIKQKQKVLYAADEGPHGQNVLQSVD